MTQSEPLLAKAERYIRSARVLAEDGDFDSAASRPYYAMFYVAETPLAASGVSFFSHSAVLSAYGQQFTKTRALDPRFHRALLGAYSQRQLGDYAVNSSLTDDDIQRLMSDAIDFIAAARAWFAQR